jgi:hypothetical protein
MNNPDVSRHVEVKVGDQTVAAADVTTGEGAEGTARTSLHAASGHIAPGSRASLVDAVMERLRQRTVDSVTRPAGSTALLDANIPSPRPPKADEVPDHETAGS